MDGGVILRRDHPELGQRLNRLRRKGELVAVLPGVLVAPDLATDWRTKVIAGLRWLGPDAVLTGHAAARLTFWPGCSREDAMFLTPRQQRSRRGWQVMTAVVPPEMIRRHHGIALTCPAYTAMMLAGGPDGGNVIDEALRSGSATLQEMRAALAAMPDRTGNQQRRWLLHDSRDKPWSELEREGHRLLRRQRLSRWQTNARVQTAVGDYAVDVLFDESRVVVEFDGYEYHSKPTAFENDRRRRNALVLAGYTVLNFTWTQVFRDPEWVIGCIRAAIGMSYQFDSRAA
ncbi:Very-short-patch-repair endonuclease [Microlunatus soli]|uniref:Very-short-patch-repair endonuclease n=2 Tax=Microlunatus soli TaxID=630515 RepID=A0A1H2ALE8_9ACTN|nr:Very-short-patch-repair endonuclease [Microlunatus soli]